MYRLFDTESQFLIYVDIVEGVVVYIDHCEEEILVIEVWYQDWDNFDNGDYYEEGDQEVFVF